VATVIGKNITSRDLISYCCRHHQMGNYCRRLHHHQMEFNTRLFMFAFGRRVSSH
jgi:hypothetical protein